MTDTVTEVLEVFLAGLSSLGISAPMSSPARIHIGDKGYALLCAEVMKDLGIYPGPLFVFGEDAIELQTACGVVQVRP